MAKKTVIQTGSAMLDKLNQLKQKFSCEDKTEFFHSGSIVFDSVISNGKGIPKGYMIEVASTFGVGKTTLFLSIAKFLCSQGKRIIYIDTEQGLNDDMMEAFDLNEYTKTNNFYRMQCTTFTEAEEILDTVLVKDTDIDLIMIDSVTNLIPEKLLESKTEEFNQPAYQARPLDLFLKKYRSKTRNAGVTMMFVNQFRNKINFLGSSQSAAGGMSLKHSMDIRIEMKKHEKGGDIRRKSSVNPKGDIIGSICKIYATKNRFTKPYTERKIFILFGKGVSNSETIIDWMVDNKYMNQGQAGRYKLTLPIYDDEISFKSQKERHEWVKEHYDELDEFIKKNGGYFEDEVVENNDGSSETEEEYELDTDNDSEEAVE